MRAAAGAEADDPFGLNRLGPALPAADADDDADDDGGFVFEGDDEPAAPPQARASLFLIPKSCLLSRFLITFSKSLALILAFLPRPMVFAF